MIDYSIPVLQFILRKGGKLELYESGQDLLFRGKAGDRKPYLEHQSALAEGEACRIVAYPVDGMANTSADQWIILWFRNECLMGDVRVSVLRGFENDEEHDHDAIAFRIALGGWCLEELLESAPDELAAEELADELLEYSEDVCVQPEWADAVMDDVQRQINEVIGGWQKAAVIDASICSKDIRLEVPGIYFICDSDDARVPCGMAARIVAGSGVTAICDTQHNVMAEAGATLFIYGAANALLCEGSSAYIDGGRSVTTLGKCELMVVRDAAQVHCFGELPKFHCGSRLPFIF